MGAAGSGSVAAAGEAVGAGEAAVFPEEPPPDPQARVPSAPVIRARDVQGRRADRPMVLRLRGYR